jgi:pimeloyl-ACP methyl ester carboxylesterase
VIHGFNTQGTATAYLRQAAAIGHRFPKANVIIVDWQVLSEPEQPDSGWLWNRFTSLASQYTLAVEASKHVGRDIAEWMKAKGIDPSTTVFTGHSLGAQIAAFASNASAEAEVFGRSVRAILAADPAGPSFHGQPLANRLDRSDAQEVIVVHTTDFLGDDDSIGTLDTFVEWPESETPDCISRHSQARDLMTESFLQPGMTNTDGTPFGVNSLGLYAADGNPRVFRPSAQQPSEALAMDASLDETTS